MTTLEELQGKLAIMESLKRKSKKFNEEFWERFDKLNTYDNKNIPEDVLMNKVYEELKDDKYERMETNV